MSEIIKAFKGFNKDMTCKGFQYEEGKEYDTDTVKICKKGFHACEYPLYVFRYYAPAESIYHEVEQSGYFVKEDDKIASTKIKIGASINIAGLVKAAIEYTNSKIKEREENTGNCGASSNTGYRGTAEAGHENSVAIAWGPESKARGVKGSYLVFAEWEDNNTGEKWEEETWDFKGAKMVRVDGEIIKEDTFYIMKNGEIVEFEE